jgi:hypothetical protein
MDNNRSSHTATQALRVPSKRPSDRIGGEGGVDGNKARRTTMNGLIYLVGLIVVILAVLSFFGLR